MKETLQFIIASIVENPDKIVIDENEENGVILYTITVDPSDMGKIIGKEGRMIRSVRNVMKIPAIKSGKRIHIDLSQQE